MERVCRQRLIFCLINRVSEMGARRIEFHEHANHPSRRGDPFRGQCTHELKIHFGVNFIHRTWAGLRSGSAGSTNVLFANWWREIARRKKNPISMMFSDLSRPQGQWPQCLWINKPNLQPETLKSWLLWKQSRERTHLLRVVKQTHQLAAINDFISISTWVMNSPGW